MTNTKKLFPFASTFFLLYAILFLASRAISCVISYQNYISFDMAPEIILPSIIGTLIGAVIDAIPFILMGIFSLNTAKKPNIVYIIALALSCLLSIIAVISPITLLSIETISKNEQTSRIFSLVSCLLLFFALALSLIYTILIKAIKKPSKISSLWPVLSVPFVLHSITGRISAHYNNLAVAEMSDFYQQADTIINPALSTIFSIIGFLMPIVLIAAFIFVALQFATVNKNLASQN